MECGGRGRSPATPLWVGVVTRFLVGAKAVSLLRATLATEGSLPSRARGAPGTLPPHPSSAVVVDRLVPFRWTTTPTTTDHDGLRPFPFPFSASASSSRVLSRHRCRPARSGRLGGGNRAGCSLAAASRGGQSGAEAPHSKAPLRGAGRPAAPRKAPAGAGEPMTSQGLCVALGTPGSSLADQGDENRADQDCATLERGVPGGNRTTRGRRPAAVATTQWSQSLVQRLRMG